MTQEQLRYAAKVLQLTVTVRVLTQCAAMMPTKDALDRLRQATEALERLMQQWKQIIG